MAGLKKAVGVGHKTTTNKKRTDEITTWDRTGESSKYGGIDWNIGELVKSGKGKGTKKPNYAVLQKMVKNLPNINLQQFADALLKTTPSGQQNLAASAKTLKELKAKGSKKLKGIKNG